MQIFGGSFLDTLSQICSGELSKWWKSFLFALFGLKFYFLGGSFRFKAKLNRMYRDFPYTLCPYTCIAIPIINIPHQSGSLVRTDEPTSTHRYHPGFIVYIKVYIKAHSWWCTFPGFGQMYNDIYSIIKNSFTALKILIKCFWLRQKVDLNS